MIRGPLGSTLTCTLFPSTRIFRSRAFGTLRASVALWSGIALRPLRALRAFGPLRPRRPLRPGRDRVDAVLQRIQPAVDRGEGGADVVVAAALDDVRSEEHTSELQSLMRNSYAVFCLKKKKTT